MNPGKLTIVDTQSGEPVVILSEDAHGMKVVGGDPRMVESLGLNKMRDLKEVADYVNSPGSNLQAMYDDPGEEPGMPEEAGQEEGAPPAESNPGMIEFDRIKPALEIIKQIAMRVKGRMEQEATSRQAAGNQAEALKTTDSEVVMEKPQYIYVSLDGDNIGNAVARAEAQDDESALAAISQKINAGQEVLRNWAIAMGGTIIEAGGDEGLVKVPGTALDHIEELRSQYNRVVGATATVGVGEKISESTKARELGKLKGKNQTVVFDETTEKELKLRLEDQDESETSKIRNAMAESEAAPGEPQRLAPDAEPNAEQPQGEEAPEQEAPEQAQSEAAPEAAPGENQKPFMIHEPDEEPRADDGHDEFGYERRK